MPQSSSNSTSWVLFLYGYAESHMRPSVHLSSELTVNQDELKLLENTSSNFCTGMYSSEAARSELIQAKLITKPSDSPGMMNVLIVWMLVIWVTLCSPIFFSVLLLLKTQGCSFQTHAAGSWLVGKCRAVFHTYSAVTFVSHLGAIFAVRFQYSFRNLQGSSSGIWVPDLRALSWATSLLHMKSYCDL